MENLIKEKSKLIKAGFVLAIVLTLYFTAKIITEIKGYNFIGGATPASNVISFDGKGEISATPDIATISFTLSDDEKDLKTAQDKVTTKETAVLSFLDSQKIDKKDIKTESYNSYPKYDYSNSVCPVQQYNGTSMMGGSLPVYCPPGKQVLSGYTVSESISVKVRDITKAGAVVQGIGAVGVKDMNGPNFSIEKEDALKAQARKMAINDAKAKAQTLSKDLGVNLVRIVNFSENGNYPIMYNTYGMAKADSAVSAPAPTLPTGENKITSNVTITYEIR
jgi:hypothetical protein